MKGIVNALSLEDGKKRSSRDKKQTCKGESRGSRKELLLTQDLHGAPTSRKLKKEAGIVRLKKDTDVHQTQASYLELR